MRCLPETILPIGSTTPVSNHEIKLWKRQDCLILHVILSLVTWAVVPLVSSTTTSHEAWKKQRTTFTNISHSRMLSLRNMLINTTKDSKSIVEYMQDIKTIVDDLALNAILSLKMN